MACESSTLVNEGTQDRSGPAYWVACIEGQWEGGLDQKPSETESSGRDFHLPDPLKQIHSALITLSLCL